MNDSYHIACDLGAESGRVVLGYLGADQTLTIKEIHRFPTGAIRVQETLRWDIQHLFFELKAGLSKVAAEIGEATPVTMSVDSWGVDYVLFRPEEPQIGLPYHYRDARTDAAYPRAVAAVPPETIFAETGIQFMSINTLYQLLADLHDRPAVLAAASQFLNIADYFHYLFTGVARAEESLASTTQLYDPVTRGWSERLIGAFALPPHLFPEITPAAPLGPATPEIREETGLQKLEVLATCSHDTGAAVAAVPAGENACWAYLSSGTWSLLGVELSAPLINEAVRAANFTNEAGLGGTTRFLKNTAGLWILQECRRFWAAEGRSYSYDELTRLAADAEPLRSLIHPGAPAFLKPGEMPTRIARFCCETGQPEPESVGAIARCIFESLALLYRENLAILRELTAQEIDTLHIVGGGSKNRLLNQLSADACGIPAIAGPVEATAIGNLLIQALLSGRIDSHACLRDVVRRSFPVETFQPTPQTPAWTEAIARYATLRS